MNTHLGILNTLNIDAEVTLRALNMLIEKIDCVFTGAGDKIIDCRQLERWIFAGAAVRFKESSTFLRLRQRTTLSRLSLPPFHLSPSTTNQVYQSLRLMSEPRDGTLVWNNKKVVEECLPSAYLLCFFLFLFKKRSSHFLSGSKQCVNSECSFPHACFSY